MSETNRVVEWIAQAIYAASDEYRDQPVAWEDNHSREQWLRMATAVTGSGEVYEVNARLLSEGNAESWVGPDAAPLEEAPAWLDGVTTGLTDAVMGWGLEDDEDSPDRLTAIVCVQPPW